VPRPGPDPSVPDTAYIRAITEDRKPVMGTQQIADKVGLSRVAATRHLERMEDNGLLHSGKAGSTTVWWPTPEGRAHLQDSSQ
jgi:predicted ArsR family transcriptional regulator